MNNSFNTLALILKKLRMTMKNNRNNPRIANHQEKDS